MQKKTKQTDKYPWSRLNPLIRNIHIQIPHTDLHTFPYRINWEDLF